MMDLLSWRSGSGNPDGNGWEAFRQRRFPYFRIQFVGVALGLVVVAGWLVVVAAESAKPAKQPVPAPEEIARGELAVRETYQAELAKADTAAEKQKLALRWIEEASATPDDPGARFALLRLAQEIGQQIGDPELILRAIDEAGKYFEFDLLSAKRSALQKAAQQPRPASQAKLFAEKCTALMQQAIKQEDFSWALDCGRAAYTAAQQAKDPVLLKALASHGQRLQDLRAAYEKVQEAMKVLAQQPEDPEANRLVGRYLCLVQENWTKGLPHLARSNDSELKQAAEKDLAQPTDVRGQIDLADLWWELAQKQSGPEKEALQRRAAWWYQRALPQATGLDKTKATARLAELTPPAETEKSKPVAKKAAKSSPAGSGGGKLLPIPEGTSADLLKQIDPKKHRLVGDWVFRGGRLAGVPGPTGTAAFHIPVQPTGSYELQMDFARTAGEGMIGLLVPVGEQRCVVVLDCRPGVHGIDTVAGQRADNNSTTARGAIQTGRTYRLEIKVVPDGSEASVTVSLDDRPLLFYRGPAQDLQLHKEFTIRGVTGMALLSRCGLAVQSLQLRPRSGQVLLTEEPAPKAGKKD
ncbi:MAG: hypothetical protein NZ602_02440 [Thermoguttaceae bacterium]|nr:hypothetical protein [Thermoguttaceae bacterium]MDW8039597.1 hypothetical protein [Thermoguttaceae bacterium]